MTLRVALVGAGGKMGRAVARVLAEVGAELVCAVSDTHEGSDAGVLAGIPPNGVAIVRNVDAIAECGAQVVIEFASPEATRATCVTAARAGIAIVSGTTGLGDVDERALDEASLRVPVLWEPNMSVGVHVLGVLAARAIEMLGDDFDIEIIESHHRQKADAPSGTATRLAEIASRAVSARNTQKTEAAEIVHGRHGRLGPRHAREIGVHAIRGGDVIGDHTVQLLGAGERIEITHRASNRDLFARGAVRAALFVHGKAAGRYHMRDVLARVDASQAPSAE